jgi:hypothetical protein
VIQGKALDLAQWGVCFSRNLFGVAAGHRPWAVLFGVAEEPRPSKRLLKMPWTSVSHTSTTSDGGKQRHHVTRPQNVVLRTIAPVDQEDGNLLGLDAVLLEDSPHSRAFGQVDFSL